MKISRTTILGWFLTFAGVSGLVGLDFDAQAIGKAFVDAWDAGATLYGLIIGPIVLWLRKLTVSPLVGGIVSSLLGIKQ